MGPRSTMRVNCRGKVSSETLKEKQALRNNERKDGDSESRDNEKKNGKRAKQFDTKEQEK